MTEVSPKGWVLNTNRTLDLGFRLVYGFIQTGRCSPLFRTILAVPDLGLSRYFVLFVAILPTRCAMTTDGLRACRVTIVKRVTGYGCALADYLAEVTRLLAQVFYSCSLWSSVPLVKPGYQMVVETLPWFQPLWQHLRKHLTRFDHGNQEIPLWEQWLITFSGLWLWCSWWAWLTVLLNWLQKKEIKKKLCTLRN